MARRELTARSRDLSSSDDADFAMLEVVVAFGIIALVLGVM
jgi:hypothetical protein